MQVRWTDAAVTDLEEIVDFIAVVSESAAKRVAEAIYVEGESLGSFPHRGRLGVDPGTRELILVESGYIITYEVVRDAVFLLRIHHGAQDWPRR
jgi:toxin ParE1/3/4